jgi:hypothetical protein
MYAFGSGSECSCKCAGLEKFDRVFENSVFVASSSFESVAMTETSKLASSADIWDQVRCCNGAGGEGVWDGRAWFEEYVRSLARILYPGH